MEKDNQGEKIILIDGEEFIQLPDDDIEADITEYFKETDKEFMDNPPEWFPRLVEVFKKLWATAEKRPAGVAQSMEEINGQVRAIASKFSEIVAHGAYKLPEWCDVELLNGFYDELDDLEDDLTEELQRIPKYRGREFRDVLYGLPMLATLYYFVADKIKKEDRKAAEEDIARRPVTEEDRQTVNDLVGVWKRTKKKAAEHLIVEKSVLSGNFLLMYHENVLTDLLAVYGSSDAVIDKTTGKATIKTENAEITIRDASGKKFVLNVNTHKLLCVAVAEFTKNNHFSKKKGEKKLNYAVVIPFDEYARQCKYAIDEEPKDTPEAQAKEKKRATNQRKLARRYIGRDCQTLRGLYVSRKNKNSGDFGELNLLEYAAIENGFIKIIFGHITAQQLANLPLMQYKRTLLGINAHNRTAYAMGFKMSMHHFNMNNIERGSDKRLKVETLLTWSELPTYEYLKFTKNGRHWTDRIREPFENALESLVDEGVISEWFYTKAKGKKLTDAELNGINSYEYFAGLYVEFEIVGEPEGQAERMERRAIKKAKAEEEAAAKDAQRAARAAKRAAKEAKKAAEKVAENH